MSGYRTLILVILLILPAGCGRKEPPATPAIPIGPSAARPGDTVDIRVTGQDPGGARLSFRCAWEQGDTSNWSDWVGSGETAALTHVWGNVGVYFITAQARNINDALSDWSAPFEMIIGNPPRRPARPEGPADGWVDTSYIYRTVSTDIDGDNLRYVFNWGGGTAETTDYLGSGEFVEMTYAWSRPDTFALTVRAIDRPGLESPWSETLRVAIRDIAGPGITLWEYETVTGEPITGVPALAHDRIIFGSTDGLVYCLDTEGNELWTYTAGGPVISAPAVAADGSVIFGSADGRVYCLTGTGTLRWSFTTDDEVVSSPAIATDGTVFVGSGDDRLYCLNPDGTLRWSYRTGGPIRSSPAISADGTIYFGSSGGHIYALFPDGTLYWNYQVDDAVNSSPALGEDETVYAVSEDGWLYALSPDGSLRWREEVGIGTNSSPVVGSDGNIYVGSATGALLAFYPAGGQVWELTLPAPVHSTPLLDDELNIYVSSGNRLYSFSTLGTGRINWYLTFVGRVEASPTVGENRTIYIGDSAGRFRAVRGAGRLDTGAWPKFRRDPRNTGRAGNR